MKEYRKIAKFKYNNCYYVMYLDNENKHFFLKINNGNLCYVTIDELLDLTKLFTSIPSYMKIEKSGKIKFAPKVIKGGISVVLSAALLSSFVIAYNEQNDSNISESEVTEFVSTDSKSDKKDLVVDTYKEGQILNYLYIYDMDYLDKVFDDEAITYEMLCQIIDNNDSIPPVYKQLLYEYCDAVTTKYPNAELRVFYENLKTLKICECSSNELLMKLGSDKYKGTYSKTENVIYVLENNIYERGSWDYQVMFHEFSHCLRTGVYVGEDGKDIDICFEGKCFRNIITGEALNSIFAVSLFDNYDEIAYQLQSNYFMIMLECMDNYDLSDYVNHSQSYFAKKLDETNGDVNEATSILDLMQMQYDDYYSDEIEVEQSEFYPIYDYLCKMYFSKYINTDMSYDEAYMVVNELVEKVVHNIPIDYNIDYSHFYDNFNKYCEEISIETASKTI